MHNFWQKRPWLKWMMLIPAATIYAAPNCMTDAIREVADGLSDAADDLDGKDDNEIDQFFDDLKDLFD